MYTAELSLLCQSSVDNMVFIATADPRFVLLTFLERISGPSVSQCVTTFFQPTELIRFEKATKLREIPDKSI